MPLRYPLAVLAGLLVAGLLLWLMQALVTPQQLQRSHRDQARLIEFVRLKRDERVQRKERRQPPPPPPPATPLPRPQLEFPEEVSLQAPRLDISARLDLPLQLGQAPSPGPPPAQLDHDFIPLSRQPPQYPYQAARRGIEGWVKVAFRVTAKGTVEDVRVLESEPPGVFDQAALDAVSRWRFKPRRVGGRAVAGEAEQVVEFKLDD